MRESVRPLSPENAALSGEADELGVQVIKERQVDVTDGIDEADRDRQRCSAGDVHERADLAGDSGRAHQREVTGIRPM